MEYVYITFFFFLLGLSNNVKKAQLANKTILLQALFHHLFMR